MTEHVAVFIDFENIAISAEDMYGQCELAPIMQTAESWGRCIIKRAYGDWTHFARYAPQLIEHAIEPIQLFRYGAQRRKNAADIQMVVDAVETAFTHPDIEIFVLVTGDSDFSAVARRLRGYGKQVVGIGLRQATSDVLVKSCDRFILYDNLIEPETRTVTFGLERGRQLLLDTMRRLSKQSETGAVLATRLKQAMLYQDPTFNELTLGFQQFRDFLKAQADLVELSTRGPQGTELVVTLKATAAEETAADESLQYRLALDAEGLRLLDPHTRTEILTDLFHLLSKHPGKHTLDDVVLELKSQYDATNILRSREEVREAAKLLKYADVLEPKPLSWELDALTLKPDLTSQAFVDQCESTYIAVLLQKNLTIRSDVVARLLFGTADQRGRVEQLRRVALENLPEGVQALREAVGWEWPPAWKESAELRIVLRDLESCALEEEPSISRAEELNNRALLIRTSDFAAARSLFLQAARMVYELLRRGQPGASFTNLEWYLASYCAATAGANFFKYDYSAAAEYYRAFFALVRDTDPVWERVKRLVPPMLSFYFTIAANENNEMLEVSPGRTSPARVASIVHKHPNPYVRKRWMQLAKELARINPTLVRMIVNRLETMETVEEELAARETRTALAALLEDRVGKGGPEAPG